MVPEGPVEVQVAQEGLRFLEKLNLLFFSTFILQGVLFFSLPNVLFEVSGNDLDCSCSLPLPDMSALSSSSATPGIVSCQSCIREALKNGIFQEYILNKGGGSGIPKLYVKFWWPLFLALKTRRFWPKVTFLILYLNDRARCIQSGKKYNVQCSVSSFLCGSLRL